MPRGKTQPRKSNAQATYRPPYHPRTNARGCTLRWEVRRQVQDCKARMLCRRRRGVSSVPVTSRRSLCRHCRTSPLGVRRSRNAACVRTCSPVVHRQWGMQVKHRTTHAPYHAHSVRGWLWLTARRPCSNCCQAYANVRHSCFARLRRTHTPPTIAKRAGREASAGAHRNDEWPMPPSLTTPIWCDPSGRRRSRTSVGTGALSS